MTARVIETKVQKRFADVDVFRHVNNIHQQEYLDLGKADYYRQVIGLDVFSERVTLMIVAVKTDFREQVRYGDDIRVKTFVEKTGTKSITLRQQIVSLRFGGAESVCTEGETVLVAFDREAQATVEIPSDWRSKINAFDAEAHP